jgi:hypothetical protein
METERKVLLKIGQMAREIGVPVGWLRQEAESGRIPCLKAERVFLFEPTVVINVLASRASKG